MRRLAVVMTHYDRTVQLGRTLASLAESAHDNFEVVVVDDASPFGLSAPVGLPYPVTVLNVRPAEKTWYNPVVAYNRGIALALARGAEAVVLQNAENFHVGDLLGHAEANLTDANYLSYSCYSLGLAETFRPDCRARAPEVVAAVNRRATADGQTGWYNHPHVRPAGYDFCAAVTRGNVIRLNGYDERYAAGVAYGDDDLVMRVRALGLDLVIPEGPYVCHQWHYAGGSPYAKADLVARNRDLFRQLAAACLPRAEHIVTPDF